MLLQFILMFIALFTSTIVIKTYYMAKGINRVSKWTENFTLLFTFIACASWATLYIL